MVQPNNQPPANGKLLFRAHRGGGELRPAAPDEPSDLPQIEDGLTFVTAQLHGDDLRVTVGATALLDGMPINREFDITDEGLLAPIRAALQDLQAYSSEYTMAQARTDAQVTHDFNKTPAMQETLQMIRDNEQAQENQ
jgi:hypothetical protein